MEPWRGSRGLPLGFVVPPVVVEQPPPLIDETALGEALHVCAWEGNADEARLLLERGAPVDWRNPDSFNYTPLITAAKYGSTEVVRLLLAHRASVNLTNDYRANPLHQAALYGHEAAVRLLLEHRGDLNAGNDCKATPLHCASSCGHASIVRLLLENNANVNAVNDFSAAALHYASVFDLQDVARLLIDYGADKSIAAVDVEGRAGTPAQVAKNDSIKLVIEQYEYRWTIKNHYRAPRHIRQTIFAIVAIRSLVPSSVLAPLPNELLFEIFQLL